MKTTLFGLVVYLTLLSASLASAKCKTDTDCKGDRVCNSGRCELPQAPPGEMFKDGIPGYSFPAAIVGYIAAPIALGVIIASDLTKTLPNKTPSTVLNLSSTFLMTTIAPIVAAGGKSVRVHPSITGIPVLKGFGWTFYSLVVGSGTALSICTALGVPLPDGVVTGVGILAFHALAFLATDALVSYYQAKSLAPQPGSNTSAPTVAIVPSIGAAQMRDGSTTPTFGAAGLF